MARLTIEGIGQVEVDDSFRTLPPERQNEVVQGIIAQRRGGQGAPAPTGAPRLTGSGSAPLELPSWHQRLRNMFGGEGSTTGDVAVQVPAGLAAGTAQAVGLPGTLQMLPAHIYDWTAERSNLNFGTNFPVGLAALAAPFSVPTGQRVQARMERDVTGPLPAPQTTAGRYVRTAAESLPVAAAAGPAAGMRALGAPNLLLNGVVPAVAGEAASDLAHVTGNAEYAPAARIGAGLIAGVTGNALLGSGRAERIAARNVGNVDPATWQRAGDIIADGMAQNPPVRITVDEALSLASNGATQRLSDLRRVVDQTPQGGERMAAAMAERVPAVEAAARNSLDSITPPTATPSAVGPEVQRQASAAIEAERQAGNAVTRPLYQAADAQMISAAEHQALMANPAYVRALERFRRDPELQSLVQGLPEGSVGYVHQVMQQLDRGIKAARGNAVRVADPPRAMVRTDARNQADVAARTASGEFGAAQDFQAAWRRQVVEPLEAGPLGRIGNTADVQEQGREMVRGVAGSEREVMVAARELATRNPEAAQQLARQHVETILNRNFGTTARGQVDQFGAARAAGEILGDAQVARNTAVFIEAVSGPAARQEFERALRVWRATGARPDRGSGTTFNAENVRQLEGGAAAAAVASPRRTFREAVRGAMLGRTSGDVADIFLGGPEGLARLQEAAARGGGLADMVRLAVPASMRLGNAVDRGRGP